MDDSPEEIEDQVLTRWDKTTQWIGLGKAIFTVGSFLKALVFGAAVVGGAVGGSALVEDRIATDKKILVEEMTSLQESYLKLELDIEAMREQIASKAPTVITGPIGPPGPAGVQGPPGENGKDGKDGVGVPGVPGKDGAEGSILIEELLEPHVYKLH